MKTKKNPKKDLNRNSGVFFIAGLTMVLALTYVAIEWKTFYGEIDYKTAMTIDDELIEEVDFIQLAPPPPPPPPPVAPEIILIVEDDPEIEDTVITETDTNQEEEIKYEDIDVAKIPDDVDVPFILVEDAPIFPGCENESDKKACFNKMINKHVRKNIRYPEIAQEMGIQGRVHMHFVIQKDGSIGTVQIARSPDKNLGKEATRIIDKLPKMTPGKQRGSPVRVPFSIPITFKLQ